MKSPINKEWMKVLACPDCKGKLSYTKDKKGLECKKCDKEYEIKNGIPILLP